MKFNTYVINLQKDNQKWTEIQNNFKNTNIQLTRFDAFLGKKLTKQQQLIKNKKVTKLCKLTCSDGIIGCGLSHIELAKMIFEKDENQFALVLEDDVIPKVNNLKQKIINLAKNAPKNWDLIKIHNVGFCRKFNNPIWMCGSTAGYLLSKKGAKKLSNLKLNYHIDIQIHKNKKFNMYKSQKNLLTVNFKDSSIAKTNLLTKLAPNIKLLNAPIIWYLNQIVFKIPYVNFNITALNLLVFLSIIAYYFYKLKGLLVIIIIALAYLIIGIQFFS